MIFCPGEEHVQQDFRHEKYLWNWKAKRCECNKIICVVQFSNISSKQTKLINQHNTR